MVDVLYLRGLHMKWKEQFDELYPSSFHASIGEILEVEKHGGKFIYIIEKKTGKPIGETFYVALDNLAPLKKDSHLEEYLGRKSAYVFKNSILKEYQGLGYGKLLTEYRIKCMKEEGFEYSIGHARDNGSIEQAKLFGAEVKNTVLNWLGTKEKVFICALKLNK